MDTNTLEPENDFFAALHSIPEFHPETSIKEKSVINIKFGGTSVDILLESQILIVVGSHAEFAFAIGRRLRAPFCYWNKSRKETVIAFGTQPTNFSDKCKMLIMMFAVLPMSLSTGVYRDKKIIIYKHYIDASVSLYLTNKDCIFVKEYKDQKPYIKDLGGEIMEDELQDPKYAEEKIDELTEASNKEETKPIKPKAVYGEAVEQD